MNSVIIPQVFHNILDSWVIFRLFFVLAFLTRGARGKDLLVLRIRGLKYHRMVDQTRTLSFSTNTAGAVEQLVLLAKVSNVKEPGADEVVYLHLIRRKFTIKVVRCL